MSVKLPLLVKRQPAVQRRSPSPKQLRQQSNKSPEYSEHYQEEYEQQHQQQVEPVEPVEPIETVVCLKKQPVTLGENSDAINQDNSQKQQQVTHKYKLQQLQRLLEQKTKTANELKGNINDRKKQIKQIGEQVDKDLNKSLFKVNKGNSVNLRDIFSAPPKSNNNKINQINQELRKVRQTIKKTKGQIQKINQGLMEAVNVINHERGTEIQARIRSFDEDIRLIEKEKTMLSDQITRGQKNVSEEEEKEKGQEISKQNAQLCQILNLLKEEKGKLYQIEKEDILLMQKVKFFQQKQGILGLTKKIKITEKEKNKIEEDIKYLVNQINNIIDERNKTEVQRKISVKNLTAEVAALQSKNWDICGRLREMDSFLLQYYEKKSRKKQIKPVQKNSDNMSNSASGKIDAESVQSQTPAKHKQHSNDKNIKSVSAEIVLVQKKKIYQFGGKQNIQPEISLSDEQLGSKLCLSKLKLVVDDNKIYRLSAVYRNQNDNIIKGQVLGSHGLPLKTQDLELQLDHSKEEVINFIHVGFNQSNYISFFHAVTSEGQNLKWGNIQNLSKSEQKHIKKYQTAYLKAKISLSPDNQTAKSYPIFVVTGFTISTVYLAPK